MTTTPQVERKHPLAECEKCPLVGERCAPTSGPADAKVALVSRSPGKHDVIAKKPFAGPSGQVLDHLLGRYGVKRNEIITTNVVLCQSDNPPPSAIAACRARLEAEIRNCELVIAAGAEATTSLTKYRSLTAARGFRHNRTSIAGIPQRVVSTNNPALVLRDSDSYPNLVQDFKQAFNPIPPPLFPKVEVIDDTLTAHSVLTKWLTAKLGTIATDLEWSGRDIYCAGFAKRGSKAVVFARECFKEGRIRALLRRLYERTDVQFLWHNGKSDTKILRANGIRGRVGHDTFLLSYVLDERPGFHALDYLLMTEFGWPDYEPQCVKEFKKNGYIADDDLPALYKYNGWDTAGTMQLFELLRERAIADNVWDLYNRRYIPASEAMLNVEMRGFHYDVEGAANLNEREVLPTLWGLTDELRQISGRELLNPNSPKQLQAIYYNQWELKHKLRDIGQKKLQTSTGVEVRTEIIDGRFRSRPGTKDKITKFANTHQKYSKIQKQRSQYIEGLIKKVTEVGKIYTTFNLAGTVSARLSSKEPNLQNITREGVYGIPGIRTLFLPSPGNVILNADFSQAELRTCAVVSGEPGLISIYNDNTRSLHKERAAAFYGENYTKEQYVKSKNINFGVTYGQSAFAFAQMYHMPEDEAQAYIDNWWREFPTLKRWTEASKLQATEEGVVVSPFGHKRRFHLITNDNIGDVEREAVNFIPQNVAGWLTICSIIELDKLDIPVIATVHDSIVVDCPRTDLESAARAMKEVMESQASKQLGWELPFTADLSAGPNWAELEDLDL